MSAENPFQTPAGERSTVEHSSGTSDQGEMQSVKKSLFMACLSIFLATNIAAVGYFGAGMTLHGASFFPASVVDVVLEYILSLFLQIPFLLVYLVILCTGILKRTSLLTASILLYGIIASISLTLFLASLG